MVLVFRRNFGAELMEFNGLGLFSVPQAWPVTALEWFELLQENRFVGLALFGLFDLINAALLGLVLLALYGALRRVSQGVMVVAMALGFVGITVYLATNQAFAMLTLSNRYTEAAGEARRAAILSAGEALLGIQNPGELFEGAGAFISLHLILLAGLLVSVVMLRSRAFHKVGAYAGILANLFALGQFVFLAVLPPLVWLPPTLSAPLRLLWYLLIAVGLFRLARQPAAGQNQHQGGL